METFFKYSNVLDIINVTYYPFFKVLNIVKSLDLSFGQAIPKVVAMIRV